MNALRLPNGMVALFTTTALHRRRPGRKYPYARPTDWIAQTSRVTCWGRTKREAIATLGMTVRAAA
jgi:hypothetical protein